MNSGIFLFYTIMIAIASLVGIRSYTHLNRSLRLMAILLIVTCVSESCSYLAYVQEKYLFRYALYHIYNVIQAIVISTYFIFAIKPYHHRKFVIANIVFWPIAGALNISFLQPIDGLNSNMLMLESFGFISMSLYSIYRLLRNDKHNNIFSNSHFWIAVISLVAWSCTLFFWATVKILYRNHWKYVEQMMVSQVIIGMLSYLAIAATLFFHFKNKLR